MAYPVIYANNATVFDTERLGVLADCTVCRVSEEINGKYEVYIEYPVSGVNYSTIQLNNIIFIKPNPYTDRQPFRIYSISKPLGGIITVYAEHKSYELNGYPCLPNTEYAAQLGSCAGMMSYLTSQAAMTASGLSIANYSFSTDISDSENWSIERPISIREAMTYAASVFGGEWEYRYENGSNICTLRTARGQDRGVSVRYGSNIISFAQDEQDDTYTHIMPYWTDGTESVYINGLYMLVSSTSSSSDKSVKIVDLSDKFTEAPTPSELYNEAMKCDEYLKPPTVQRSLKVSFVPLGQTTEYAYLTDSDHVELGDTVGAVVDPLGIETSARCSNAVFDALTERYDSVTLGATKETLYSSVKAAAAKEGVNWFASPTEPTEKCRSGDFWIKIDNVTDRNAISLGRYNGSEWLLLCKYGQGGGGTVTLPNVFVTQSAPIAEVNESDFLVSLSGNTVTALKQYQSGTWTTVEYLYGSNPTELTEEGIYYVYVTNGHISYIFERSGSSLTVVAFPSDNPQTGHNVFYVNSVTDIAVVGDYWLEVDNDNNLYSVNRLEQGTSTAEWETLYNSAVPALYVSTGEPASAFGLKEKAIWIQIDNFDDKKIVAVKQRLSNAWYTICVPGSGSGGDVTINISHAILVEKGSVV